MINIPYKEKLKLFNFFESREHNKKNTTVPVTFLLPSFYILKPFPHCKVFSPVLLYSQDSGFIKYRNLSVFTKCYFPIGQQ
jgi:hypothetical protein